MNSISPIVLTTMLATVAAVGFVVAHLIVRVAIRWAFALDILDRPGTRRFHLTPVPRTGGFGVFVGSVVATVTVCLIDQFFPTLPSIAAVHWTGVATSAGLIWLVGLVDDCCQPRPVFKLFGQIAAALLLYCSGVRIPEHQAIAGSLLELGATVGWVVLVTNALNLIDGLDGLAASLSSVTFVALVGLAICFGHHREALLLAGVLGSTLGFLVKNWHPAEVFLGDSGSHFLGFVIAIFSLLAPMGGGEFSRFGLPLLILGVPLMDTCLAIWRRSVRRLLSHLRQDGPAHGLFKGDLYHLHHRLARQGLSAPKVCATLVFINIALTVAGLLVLPFPGYAIVILLGAFVTMGWFVTRYFPLPELWDSGLALLRLIGNPAPTLLPAVIFIVLDSLVMAASYLISVRVVYGAQPRLGESDVELTVLFSAACIVLSLFTAEVVLRLKGRSARARALPVCLIFGVLISMRVLRAWHSLVLFGELVDIHLAFLVFYSISLIAMLLIRQLPRVVEYAMTRQIRQLLELNHPRNILIVQRGGTADGTHEKLGAPPHVLECRLRTNSTGKTVQNDEVLYSSIADLSGIILEHAIRQIVVTTVLTKELHQELLKMVAQHSLPMIEWYDERKESSACSVDPDQLQ